MNDRFVITGSGRCGTTWISRALTRVGVPTGHEAVFHPGEPVWPEDIRGDSSWVAACKLDEVDEPVALLVRHPLAVVKSLMEIGFFTWDTGNSYHEPLAKAFPHVHGWANPQDRALSMWFELNLAALSRAEMIIRFESIIRNPALFGRLLAWTGGDPGRSWEALTEPPCNRHQESRERTGCAYTAGWEVHDSGLTFVAQELAGMLGYQGEKV